MSLKAMTSVVAAVAFAVIAARDVRPAQTDPAVWSRGAPLQINEALPPGHPPIPGRLPPGHPPLDLQPRLPEGHPPIPGVGPGCPGQRGMPDAGIVLGRDEREVIST